MNSPDTSSEVFHFLETYTQFMKIDVAGAIGTIVTAVVARYGLREATKNLRGKEDEK